jgi:hypothetical protein
MVRSTTQSVEPICRMSCRAPSAQRRLTDAVRAAIDEHIEKRRADRAFRERLDALVEQDGALLERTRADPEGRPTLVGAPWDWPHERPAPAQ